MSEVKQSCCSKHYMRCPYTHSELVCDYCCIGCDKPGIASMEYNPSDSECSDCAIICLPCTIVLDIFCCIPMTFGCYILERP